MTAGDAVWIVAGGLLLILAGIWVSRGRTRRPAFQELAERPCALCGDPIPPGIPLSVTTCEGCAVALSEVVWWWRSLPESTRHYRLAAWRKAHRVSRGVDVGARGWSQ
jgi:hypothetical protein